MVHTPVTALRKLRQEDHLSLTLEPVHKQISLIGQLFHGFLLALGFSFAFLSSGTWDLWKTLQDTVHWNGEKIALSIAVA